MATVPGGALRRNGRQQSCEACRKMKIRCDHTNPKCGRCNAKDLECVYEDAPMTTRFRSARFDAESGRVRSITMPQDVEAPIQRRESRTAAQVVVANAFTSSAGESVVATEPAQSINTLAWDSMGNLSASTPLCSLFDVSNQQAFEADSNWLSSSQNQSAYTSSAGSPTTNPRVDLQKLAPGLQVIEFVRQNRVLLKNLMEHIYRVMCMPIIPSKITFLAAESFLSMFENDAGMNVNEANQRIVVRIFESSRQAIPSTKLMTSNELLQVTTKNNLRWETVGNILYLATLCLVGIRRGDLAKMDPLKRNKEDLLEPFYKTIDCLATSIIASPMVDELGVCLKYNQLLLTFQRHGDSSQISYTTFLELISMTYTTGIHQDAGMTGSDGKGYSCFMREWRRRCFAVIYSMDKTIAAALNRPPLMMSQYCTLCPPLDLDDEDLAGSDWEQQIQRLDRHGWNTDGRRRAVSFVRVRYMLATVREKAMELKFGSGKLEKSPGKAQIVLQELQYIWDTCPSHLRYSSALWDGPKHGHSIWFILCFYIEYLYSRFLLLHVNAEGEKQSPASLELLLTAAKDVLSAILVFTEQRQHLKEIRDEFSGVFIPYGLPCAEYLAKDLQKWQSSFVQIQSSGHTRSPRAEIIRTLTAYVWCLSWFPPSGGKSADVCKEVQPRLTKILDEIIDQPVAPVGSICQDQNMINSTQDMSMANLSLDHANGNLSHNFDLDMAMNLGTGMHWDSQFDFLAPSL